MSETRKLAAILVSDVVGYSRLAGADEDRILARLRGLRSDLIDPADRRRITAASSSAPATAASSNSAASSTRCAARSKCRTAWSNAMPACREDRRIEFRIGIHLGDVVEESDGDLMGDGVNIAARLEGIAAARRDLSLRGRLSAGERAARSGGHAISARPSSRTSPSRSASIRCRSASPRRRSRRNPRRPQRPRRRRGVSGSRRSPPRSRRC